MRVGLAVGLPVAAAIVQASLAPYVSVADARPNVLALVVLCWSLVAGASEGVWWAFAGGIAADLVSGAPFGAFTLSLLPLALAFGLRPRRLERSILPSVGLVAVGALIHQVLFALLVRIVGVPAPPAGALLLAALAGAAYTGALAILAYPALRALHRRTTKLPAFDW